MALIQPGLLPERTRLQLNGILSELQGLVPGYGGALPAEAAPEGRLFTLTTTQTLYQAQSGAWVAVGGAP